MEERYQKLRSRGSKIPYCVERSQHVHEHYVVAKETIASIGVLIVLLIGYSTMRCLSRCIAILRICWQNPVQIVPFVNFGVSLSWAQGHVKTLFISNENEEIRH